MMFKYGLPENTPHDQTSQVLGEEVLLLMQ